MPVFKVLKQSKIEGRKLIAEGSSSNLRQVLFGCLKVILMLRLGLSYDLKFGERDVLD